MRRKNELPEEFMMRIAQYFSGTARTDYADISEEITALRVRHNALAEALKVAMCSLRTYGNHPIVEAQANRALSGLKEMQQVAQTASEDYDCSRGGRSDE